MRCRPTRYPNGLVQGRGQRCVPAGAEGLMFRRPRRMHHQASGVLYALARRVGVEVHDVVRVHEADAERPGLALVGQHPAVAAQPRHGTATDHVVEGVAALRVGQHVAGPDEIREPIGLHLRREQPVGRMRGRSPGSSATFPCRRCSSPPCAACARWSERRSTAPSHTACLRSRTSGCPPFAAR